MPETTTLTRTKLVTREIKETLLYTPFGKGNVAVKVNVVVSGVDPFKTEHYAIMTRSDFDAVIKLVAKSKLDFPYRDIVISKDGSYHWHYCTAAELKSFGEFPADDQMSTNLYAFVTNEWESSEKITDTQRTANRAAKAKKIYTNAVTKNGASLIWFNFNDHTGWTADGELIVQPMIVDYGFRSGVFKLKSLVRKMREQDNVHMRIKGRSQYDVADSDYPEITSIPHYNAEFNGETEISLWFIPTVEQYNDIRGGEKYVSMSTWEIMNRNLLPIAEFKKEDNDDY